MMRATISGEVSTVSPECAPGDCSKAEKLLKPMNWPPRASKAEAGVFVRVRQTAESRKPIRRREGFAAGEDLLARVCE